MGLQVANLHYFRPRSMDRAGKRERERVVCCSTGDHRITHCIYTAALTIAGTLAEDLLRLSSCAISWVIISMSHIRHRTRDTQVILLWPDPFMSDTELVSCRLLSDHPLIGSPGLQLCSTVWYYFFFFFFNKHTQLLRIPLKQWQQIEPDSNFCFLFGPFCGLKKLPLKPHSKTIINILNYLHRVSIKTEPPVLLKSENSSCSNYI